MENTKKEIRATIQKYVYREEHEERIIDDIYDYLLDDDMEYEGNVSEVVYDYMKEYSK